jgi:hypothetical protein
MSDQRIVTVEPGRWVAVATDGEGAGRMVTEVFHANPGSANFAVAAEPLRSGGRLVRPDLGQDLTDGYRTRVIPFEDSTYQRFVQDAAPEPPKDALSGHPMEGTGLTPEESRDLTDRTIEEGLEKGWYSIVGQDVHGRDVYRLTAEGADRAERLMGLPPGSVPIG